MNTIETNPIETTRKRPTGMLAFILIWIGQVISLFGSLMTVFALTVWAWQKTGQATSLTLLTFAYLLPNILLSPIAGVLVDRWDRKRVMILSDLGAGLTTLTALALYFTHHLQIWHLYGLEAIAGALQAFQFPAYFAAITMMVPKEHYVRANGMISAGQSVADILAPVAAGLLLTLVGINGVMTIDLITFVIAIGALLIVRVPRPAATKEGLEAQGSFWQEAAYGFRYILARASLLGLQLVFFAANLLVSFGYVLIPPLILAVTDNNTVTLGSVQTAAGFGGLIGGLLLSAWGGPKRKVHGILIGILLTGLLGNILMGVGHSVIAWALAAFLISFFMPIVNASNQAIWQTKVAPDIQGRVFAARRLIAQIAQPLTLLVVGPLVDLVFEPAMMPGGGLASTFGGLTGVGPGAGMSLMFIFAGVMGVIVGLSGYAFRAVRQAEELLPDYEAATADA